MTPPANTASWSWDKIANRLIWFISIGVLINLVLSLWMSGGTQSWQLAEFQGSYFLLALLLSLFPWCTHGLRLLLWARLLRRSLSFREAVEVAVLTDVGSAVTPTVVGGAPLKIGMLKRHGFRTGEAGILVAMSSIEDILFFLGVSIASIWMAPPIGLSLWKAVETKYHYWLIGAIAFVVFLSVLYRLIWHRQAAGWAKWRRKLRRAVLETCVVFRFILRSGGTTFLLSALLNVLQWSSRFGVLLALVAALGVEANFLGLFFLQWMVYIAMTLVPTPGASGGAEAAFYLIYQTLLPSSVIGLASAGWRIITYYFILFLGLVFLQFGQIARRYKWQLDVPS